MASPAVAEGQEWHMQVAQVLPLVLLHCEDASRPQLVCSLLQVSTTIQRAVQQSRARCHISFSVSVIRQPDSNSSARITSFARWLTKHSGLLGSIRCFEPSASVVAEQVMLMGLEVCAERAAAAAALAAATAAAAATTAAPSGVPGQDRLLPPPLRLASFHTDYLARTPVLQLLPFFDLKNLVMYHVPEAVVTPGFCRAVAQLQKLKSLDIRIESQSAGRGAMPLELAEAVGALTNLTYLDIELPATALQHLPSSLQELRLVVMQEEGDLALVKCELRHLNALCKLTVHCPAEVAVKAQLPAGLEFLRSFHLEGACGGKGLQKADLTSPAHAWPGLMQGLRCSAQLSQLILGYDTFEYVWRGQEDVPYLIDALVELQQLPAAHMFRQLSLDAHHTFLTQQEAAVGDILQHMSALRDLELRFGAVDRADVLALARASCMAQLTRLQLVLGAGLDDFAAVAVVCAPRDVQRLSLIGAFQSYAVLPVVAQQLTSLCDLCLQDTGGVCVGVQELHQLAPLTSLNSLTLPVDCFDAELDQFVGSMPHLLGVIRPQLRQYSEDYGEYEEYE